MGKIVIRQPQNESDYQKIHHLNHAVFSTELAQHQQYENCLLIDKFHHKNIYFCAFDTC